MSHEAKGLSEPGFRPESSFSALPIEYRYNTWLAGCLVTGIFLMVLLVVCARGPFVVAGLVAALGVTAMGAAGLFADPSGFMHSVGKKLIITDEELVEVDEKGRVRWRVVPDDIVDIRAVGLRAVFPGWLVGGWRAEILEVVLRSGNGIRIPVWLLPGRGRRFKRRFDVFVAQSESERKVTPFVRPA